MNKQTGQVVILVLLVVCLTAGLWAYMRWSNHQTVQSLNQSIERLDSSLADKNQVLKQLEEDKKNLIDEIAQVNSRLDSESARFVAQEQTFKNELAVAKSQYDEQGRTVQALNQSIKDKTATIENLESQVNEKSSGIDSLTLEKQTLLRDIATMTEKLTAGNAELSSLTAERDTILAQVQTLESELADLNQYSQQLNQQYQRVQNELASEIERSQNYSEQIETLEEQYAREQAALTTLEDEINQYRKDNQSLQAENSSLLTNNQQLGVEKRQLIQQYENGISVIRLPNRILFATGSAQLSEQGRETLVLVARTLKEFPEHLISVEGHTDHRPIGSVLANSYPSNWELSSARAASAIRVLVAENIPAEQFQVVGFADTRPLVDKSQTEQLSQNRRIEILLFPPIERKQKELEPVSN